jgi:hypothetical protein
MPQEVRRMVLRSINLPPELDDQLRAVAFVVRRPKSDLIRMFVAEGLKHLMKHLRSVSEKDMPNEAEKISRDVPYSEEEQKRLKEDFARIQRFIDSQSKARPEATKPFYS